MTTKFSPSRYHSSATNSDDLGHQLFISPLHELATRAWLIVMLISFGWFLGLIYFVVYLLFA